MTEIYKLSDKIYRIRHWVIRAKRESLASKYKIINLIPDGEVQKIYSGEDNVAAIEENGYNLAFSLSDELDGGFDIRLPLDPSDRLFGLGDVTRDTFQHRGKSVYINMADGWAYGPIPYIMCSRGWGIIVNCTYPFTFDVP